MPIDAARPPVPKVEPNNVIHYGSEELEDMFPPIGPNAPSEKVIKGESGRETNESLERVSAKSATGAHPNPSWLTDQDLDDLSPNNAAEESSTPDEMLPFSLNGPEQKSLAVDNEPTLSSGFQTELQQRLAEQKKKGEGDGPFNEK